MPNAVKRLLWRLTTICALALVGLAMACPPALAEEAQALEIDFSISPGEMAAPGDATMTFIIINPTRFDIHNVYLTSADGLLSEPIGQIGAGETQTLVRPHAVTQEELDAGEVSYVLTHDAPDPGGEKVSHTLTAPVTKGSARPDVDFTRQLSSKYVAAGSQLTITYKLTNNGNVPASAIVVRDALGDFTGRLDQLEVGGVKSFISHVTVNGPVESEASLEYTVPSGETFTRKLDPIRVRLSDSALDAAFSVGRSVFDADRADAILTLTNTGSDDYTGITVTDDVYGGVIADAVALPTGSNPYEVAYTYPVRGSGEYRWRVTGVSQSGEVLDFVTETLTLYDEPVEREIGVRMTASARTPRINRAGRVTFEIAMVNSGTVMAQNLKLYEVSRGDIRTLAVLPVGEPTRCQVSYDVTEDSEFIFCLNYNDADNRPRTITAAPVNVVISPAGVAPERDDAGDMGLEGASVKMGTSSTFTILLAVASAALVSMFTILLVTSLRARQDRRRRIAAQRRRARAEQDRIKPTGRRRKRKPQAAQEGSTDGKTPAEAQEKRKK